VLNRIEWAKEVGARLPAGFDPLAIADAGMGALLKPDTRLQMSRAPSAGDAIALLIASPEFQRR
jgi:uncharacterized protein (DUF1800 family)